MIGLIVLVTACVVLAVMICMVVLEAASNGHPFTSTSFYFLALDALLFLAACAIHFFECTGAGPSY